MSNSAYILVNSYLYVSTSLEMRPTFISKAWIKIWLNDWTPAGWEWCSTLTDILEHYFVFSGSLATFYRLFVWRQPWSLQLCNYFCSAAVNVKDTSIRQGLPDRDCCLNLVQKGPQSDRAAVEMLLSRTIASCLHHSSSESSAPDIPSTSSSNLKHFFQYLKVLRNKHK